MAFLIDFFSQIGFANVQNIEPHLFFLRIWRNLRTVARTLTNNLDIHGNFSELLDLLIDQRAHDCYGLVYFSHLPVKPRQ